MGVTRNTPATRLVGDQLATTPKPVGRTKAERVARAAEMKQRYEAGESSAAIAAAYGMTQNGVIYVLRAAGAVMRRRGRKRAMAEAIATPEVT